MEKYLQPFTSEILYVKQSKLSNHDEIKNLIVELYDNSPVKEEGNFYGTGLTTYFYDDFTSHLDSLPEFQELKQLILTKSEQYIRNRAKVMQEHGVFGIVNDVEFKLKDVGLTISKLWFNVNPKGGYQGRHHHSSNLLGGTYYLSVPESSGAIGFTNPNQFSYLNNQRPRHEHLTIDSFTMYTEAGDLLIWPGWMDHEISLNVVSEPRMTLSWGVNWGDDV